MNTYKYRDQFVKVGVFTVALLLSLLIVTSCTESSSPTDGSGGKVNWGQYIAGIIPDSISADAFMIYHEFVQQDTGGLYFSDAWGHALFSASGLFSNAGTVKINNTVLPNKSTGIYIVDTLSPIVGSTCRFEVSSYNGVSVDESETVGSIVFFGSLDAYDTVSISNGFSTNITNGDSHVEYELAYMSGTSEVWYGIDSTAPNFTPIKITNHSSSTLSFSSGQLASMTPYRVYTLSATKIESRLDTLTNGKVIVYASRRNTILPLVFHP